MGLVFFSYLASSFDGPDSTGVSELQWQLAHQSEGLLNHFVIMEIESDGRLSFRCPSLFQSRSPYPKTHEQKRFHGINYESSSLEKSYYPIHRHRMNRSHVKYVRRFFERGVPVQPLVTIRGSP